MSVPRSGDKSALLIAFHFPPDGGSSGVLRPLKFSKYLPGHGWTPHVLTVRDSLFRVRDEGLLGDVPPEATVHRTLAWDSARHLAIGGRYLGWTAIPDRFISWLPLGITAGLRIIRREGIRVIWSTSPVPTAHLIAAALRARSGIPWIADFRDPWIEEGIYPPPGSFRLRVERWMERRVLQRADRITVTTQFLKDEIADRHRWLDPSRIIVIYNGYDEADFANVRVAARVDRFEIAHAGFVNGEFRDPLPLLRVVAELIHEGTIPRNRILVTFLGGGAYLESREFRDGVAPLGLDGVVEIAPRVPHREALERLHAAGALLLLQASEDTRGLIPAKAFEYLRSTRPLLSLTPEGATSSLLKGMPECTVVDPSNKEALRGAVQDLYQAWARAPGAPTGPRPVEQFERRRLTGELARLFESLAKPPASGSSSGTATPDRGGAA